MKPDDQTLARLMQAAQQGDKQAYSALLRECSSWLHNYLRAKIAPEQLPDLVQDILLALHRKRASYDPARPFLPWLAAIARYRWVDALRKSYRRAEHQLDQDLPSDAQDDEAVNARISLERMFGALSENQHTAIQLVKIEGLSIAEASERSGQSESAVKVNIHRGLRKLSALVEKAE